MEFQFNLTAMYKFAELSFWSGMLILTIITILELAGILEETQVAVMIITKTLWQIIILSWCFEFITGLIDEHYGEDL